MSPGALHLIRASKRDYQKRRRDAARGRGDCGVCCRRHSGLLFKCSYCAGLGAVERRPRGKYTPRAVKESAMLVCCQSFGRHRMGCEEERERA